MNSISLLPSIFGYVLMGSYEEVTSPVAFISKLATGNVDDYLEYLV